ncbi:septum formation protein Maf [Curvibacter sp. CHRR-16]|uniref:Maf family protein n=1 Tax=Curvibacter sp. CHRR-16 TaxID=2835872 RepID=UPI001BDA7950|nr:Maf family protein [Curvibacter sp. CHRR-16]MBT0569355.1 septum formation protein Maf [Curvibacter sp. CHRR-16]
MADFIYLASQSPRRRELLTQLGVAHELLLPDAHEDAEALEEPMACEPAREYVQRVTGLKFVAANERWLRRQAEQGLVRQPIVCADTTVTMDGHILGKPRDAEHAAQMLRRLSGATHTVYTAIAVGWPERDIHACKPVQLLSSSVVHMATMGEEDIAAYVASGEPMGKAGAYGIQGRAAAFIARIEGSYSGIMGLPLYETAQALGRLAWPVAR